MTTRSTVFDTIAQVAAGHQKHLAPLSGDLPLLDAGPASLCLAAIVARLEDKPRVASFGTAGELAFPVTIGNSVTLHESAAA